MKANCLRRRHSRRTDTHFTYSDPFPLAQWQRNSSRDSCLVAKPVPPPTAALHPGARGGGKARLRRNGGGPSWIRSVPVKVRTQPLHCSALARKLIDKEVISKEEMSGIVDEAGVLLSRAPAGVMGQARTNLLPKFRQHLGIEDQSR